MKSYRVYDEPTNGTAGQFCGTFTKSQLTPRLRALIDSDPTAVEWRCPALTEGDSGEELTDLVTVVRIAD